MESILKFSPRWPENRIPNREDLFNAVRCPFPRRRNPYTDEVIKYSKSWLNQFYPDPAFSQRVLKAKMPEFTAGFYPEAGLEQLSMATFFLFWAFALDDLGDETDTGRVAEELTGLAQFFHRLDPVLNGEHPPLDSSDTLLALDDILKRLAGFATSAQILAFTKETRVYFDAMLWEANNRAMGTIPDEIEFQTYRPAAGAAPPFFELIFPVNNIYLPDDIRFHPKVKLLTRLAGRVMCWLNDILSYQKEKNHFDIHNLVIIFEVRRNLPVGKAFKQAVQFCNGEIEQFITIANKLPVFGKFENELQRYIHTLESMMRITLDWTYESTRYTLPPPTSLVSPSHNNEKYI